MNNFSYKHYDGYEVLNFVQNMGSFTNKLLIYELNTEKYVYINDIEDEVKTTNIHEAEQNNTTNRIKYFNTLKTAMYVLESLIEEQFPGILIDNNMKKALKENIPHGYITYKSDTKERFVKGSDGIKEFNSCFLPKQFYLEHTKDMTISNFVENTLPKFPEFQTLFDNLFDDNKEDMKWFLNWLGASFKGRKNLTLPIISGRQGSGKGLLMSYVSWYFGQNNVLTASNELLTSQFNEQMENRLFVNLNEITLNKNRELYEKLKQWVTDPVYNLNVKGVRQVIKPNNMNFLLTTNNNVPIEVALDDRRYSMFKTKRINIKTIVDNDWFRRFKKSFEDFTLEFKKCIIDFEMADLAIDSELKESVSMLSNTKQDILMNMISECDIEQIEQYEECFLDSNVLIESHPKCYLDNAETYEERKFLNGAYYRKFIQGILEGRIENRVAFFVYRSFVNEKETITKMGNVFTSEFGKWKETSKKGEKIKFRDIKKGEK